MNFPFLSNFAMRELPKVGAWPSEMKMSPFRAKAIPSAGRRHRGPCRLARLAQSHQHLPVRRQFEDLITLAFFRVAVDRPDIAFRVGFHRVRKRNIPAPKFFNAFPSGDSSHIGASCEPRQPCLAAVHHPDIVLPSMNTLFVGPRVAPCAPAGDLFVRIGDLVDARIAGLRLRHANEGRGREYYTRKSDRFHIPPYSLIHFTKS